MTPTPEPDVHHPHMAAHEALAEDTWTWEAWCLYVAEAQEGGESPLVAMEFADAMMRDDEGRRRAEQLELRARLDAMTADLRLTPLGRLGLEMIEAWERWRDRRSSSRLLCWLQWRRPEPRPRYERKKER